jgi:hypothetical protein
MTIGGPVSRSVCDACLLDAREQLCTDQIFLENRSVTTIGTNQENGIQLMTDWPNAMRATISADGRINVVGNTSEVRRHR